MALAAHIDTVDRLLRAVSAMQYGAFVLRSVFNPLRFLMCLLVFGALGPVVSTASAEEVSADQMVVIAHPSVNKDIIARRTLRAIFGMRMRNWSDGESITVFVLDDRDPSHMHFCESNLGMLPYNLRRHWDRLIFSGTGRAPIRVSTAEEMISLVRSTPGAIGYVREDMADDSVAVLQIG